MESIGHAQAAILKFGADRSIRLCLKRNLQTTAEEYLNPGDIVDVWVPKRNDGKVYIARYMILVEMLYLMETGSCLSTLKDGLDIAQELNRR